MKRNLLAFLLCLSTIAFISELPVFAASAWPITRSMAKGMRDMSEASRTIFNSMRTAVRDNGLSTIISYTASQNGGKGMSYLFGVNNGYLLVKSGTYNVASGIASGKTFNYCIFITDTSSVVKGRIYFNDIEKPYSNEVLIVIIPDFFDSTAPASTIIELYCYNDGTIPSMKISYVDGTLKVRGLARNNSDVYEVSSFIYHISSTSYYTVVYAAKKTGSNYSLALQGAMAGSTTPSNNGYNSPGSGTNLNYGKFTSDSSGTFISDQNADDLDTNYSTRAVVSSIYTSMTTGDLLAYFNVSGNLSSLSIAFTSYPN